MSGLLVLFACLAVAVAIAVPAVARASNPTSGNPPNTMMRKAGGEQEVFLKLDGIVNFLKLDGQMDKRIKLTDAECRGLIIVVHKGTNATGPVLATTNGMPGKAPGTCVYSFKQPLPANDGLSVGIESFSWGSEKLPVDQFSKLGVQDKWFPYHKDASGAWIKDGIKGEGVLLKLESKHITDGTSLNGDGKTLLKFDYKEHTSGALNLPIFIKLMPGQ